MEIQILGGGGEVGRMAVLVKGSSHAFLMDYGVNFDDEGHPVFPLHVRPRDLTAVMLSHSHLDHCGALPSLYVSSPPPLYATKLTTELAELMFKDAIKLSGYYLPYEDDEVRNALRRVVPVGYGDTVEFGGDRATFINAGHVPGSMMTYLEVDGRGLVFTGDFNLSESNLLNGADVTRLPRDLDYVVMEATYTSGNHPPKEELDKSFIEAVKTSLEEGGSVLIPSFTIGRAQEILMTLVRNNVVDVPIVVDGLARMANQIIAKHPQFLRDPDLYGKAMKASVEVLGNYYRRQVMRDQAVIIAPAGMLKGGASLYYFKRLARDKRNAVILPSFQAPDTPGFELLSRGAVRIGNEEIRVNAKVYWFDFSAHSGLRELVKFIDYFSSTTKVILVHTEPLSSLKFAQALGRELYVTKVSGERIIE
ncbi:mRNA 3'-end processing factor [Thermocladium modestius]|uniref:mRNA 3'-end processing factor n=1 Tax=Thermocladium modestius TaxID=62609 RepID=A0A830GW92_9CREN|nr:MBL fold metallo-hydrolase [Thermocladium modestius]GGP19538.1 mRNA 3'-end processing factor [Thermocladium modestius]